MFTYVALIIPLYTYCTHTVHVRVHVRVLLLSACVRFSCPVSSACHLPPAHDVRAGEGVDANAVARARDSARAAVPRARDRDAARRRAAGSALDRARASRLDPARAARAGRVRVRAPPVLPPAMLLLRFRRERRRGRARNLGRGDARDGDVRRDAFAGDREHAERAVVARSSSSSPAAEDNLLRRRDAVAAPARAASPRARRAESAVRDRRGRGDLHGGARPPSALLVARDDPTSISRFRSAAPLSARARSRRVVFARNLITARPRRLRRWTRERSTRRNSGRTPNSE